MFWLFCGVLSYNCDAICASVGNYFKPCVQCVRCTAFYSPTPACGSHSVVAGWIRSGRRRRRRRRKCMRVKGALQWFVMRDNKWRAFVHLCSSRSYVVDLRGRRAHALVINLHHLSNHSVALRTPGRSALGRHLRSRVTVICNEKFCMHAILFCEKKDHDSAE